jgi:hypothetical protein
MGEIVRSMRAATFQPKFKMVARPEPSPLRRIGLGMSPDLRKIRAAENVGVGLAHFCDWVKDSVNCPIWNMPVVEQVRWGMQGPQTDISVKKNFGAEIDLFGSGKSPEGIDYVETTMAQPGEFQTHTIACAILFHLEPEPLCWTAFGNAWTHPAGTVGAGGLPISPDVFTALDAANGCLGANVGGHGAGTDFFSSAVLEWGWWANYVSWHMVRGYNLRWKIGQHTNIMDEVLRHSAYMPTNGQEGSSSSSEVDIDNFVRRVNDRYDSLGSPLDFLKVNRIRIGSVGTGAANFGIFRPSNDDQVVGATYGGIDLRSLLKGNSEFRKLSLPYLVKAGIPIGLIAQECDTDQADTMRAYLALSQVGSDFGGVFPPTVTDDENIPAISDGTGVSPVGLERTLDSQNQAQQVNAGRVVFKGGDLKVTLGIKGFEVTEDWCNMLHNNPDLKDAVMSETNIRFGTQGA